MIRPPSRWKWFLVTLYARTIGSVLAYFPAKRKTQRCDYCGRPTTAVPYHFETLPLTMPPVCFRRHCLEQWIKVLDAAETANERVK